MVVYRRKPLIYLWLGTRMRRKQLLGLALLLGSLPTGRAEACRLWEWLTGQPAESSSVSRLLPRGNGNVYSVARPFNLQRVVVGYVPRTRYQTQWIPAPVTYYRPVTAMDPATSAMKTTLQPCTGYQWQQRRVPVTSYRPIYSTVSVPNRAPTVPVAAQPGTPLLGAVPALTMAPGMQQPTPTLTAPAVTAPAVTVPSPQPSTANRAPTLGPGVQQQQQVNPLLPQQGNGVLPQLPPVSPMRLDRKRSIDLQPIPDPARRTVPHVTRRQPVSPLNPRYTALLGPPAARSAPIAWDQPAVAKASFLVPIAVVAPVSVAPVSEDTGWRSVPVQDWR
ncbi:MAG: hypothetical protein CMJ75_05395 [Planctomycetaceae bacterium]|nr:hypothetical protein [Planctomycetaceae bacterium]